MAVPRIADVPAGFEEAAAGEGDFGGGAVLSLIPLFEDVCGDREAVEALLPIAEKLPVPRFEPVCADREAVEGLLPNAEELPVPRFEAPLFAAAGRALAAADVVLRAADFFFAAGFPLADRFAVRPEVFFAAERRAVDFFFAAPLRLEAFFAVGRRAADFFFAAFRLTAPARPFVVRFFPLVFFALFAPGDFRVVFVAFLDFFVFRVAIQGSFSRTAPG